MLSKFLDRTKQIAALDTFLQEDSEARVLVVTGAKSTGKSEFIRFASHRAGSATIKWPSNLGLHRCFPNDFSIPFSLLEELLLGLYKSKPDSTTEMISRIDISKIQAAATRFIVSLAKDVIPLKNTLQGLEELLQDSIRNDTVSRILASASERDALRSFLGLLLSDDNKDKSYIFLDDAHYADLDSLSVIFSIMTSPPANQIGLMMSVSDQIPDLLNDMLKDFFWGRLQSLTLDDLTIDEYHKLFCELHEEIASHTVRHLYALTGGNFGKLADVLPLNQIDLKRLADQFCQENPQRQLSLKNVGQDISEPKFQKFRPLFALRLSLSEDMPTSLVVRLSELGLVSKLKPEPEHLQITNEIDSLNIHDNLSIVHGRLIFRSSFLSNIQNHFAEVGDIDLLMRQISDSILRDFRDLIFFDPDFLLCVPFIVKYSPKQIASFIIADFHSLDARQIGMGQLTALAKIAPILHSRSEEKLTMILANLMTVCWSRSLFFLAVRIFPLQHVDKLSLDCALKLLDCARECGHVREISSSRFKKILSFLAKQATSSVSKIQYARTICPILEHRGDYEDIKKIYSATDKELQHISPCDVDVVKYQLNRGLSTFHGNIISNLRKMRTVIDQIPGELNEKDVLRAICENQIGMAYFYTAKYHDAINRFDSALELTEKIGRRSETPLNNLAASEIMLGRFDRARVLLSRGLAYIGAPRYQMLTMKLNFSFTIHKLGHTKEAVELASPYAEGQIKTPDPSLETKFQINLGYFYSTMGMWADANSLYMKAASASFRFQEDRIKHTLEKMAQYTAVKAGYISGKNLGDFGFLLNPIESETIMEKPFIIDINSLYVF